MREKSFFRTNKLTSILVGENKNVIERFFFSKTVQRYTNKYYKQVIPLFYSIFMKSTFKNA